MKTKLLFKSLLVAATLSLGGANSVWGQITAFSQDFTAISESTTPSDYGFTVTGTTTESMSAAVTDGKLVLVSGGHSNSRGYDAKTTFTGVGSGNEVNFTCSWAIGNASGNNNADGTAGSFSKLTLGDGTNAALEIKYCGQDKYLMVNNVKVKENVNRDQTLAVSATLNMNTQKITALTIGTVYTVASAIDFYSASATTISAFTFSHWARAGWTNTSSIDNVSITYSEARESVESFVVNYKYGEEVIASENIGTAGLYTGDSYTVPFRMYVAKDGALYKTTANGSGSYYRDVITLTTNTVVDKSLTAVGLGGGTLELLEDLDDTDGENASVRASYGSCYNNKSYTSAVTLTPGVYTFIFRAQNKNRGSSVKVGETTVCSITDINSTTGTWTDKTIENVEIYSAGNVTLVKGGSNTIDCYDIIIAIRTGNVTVSKTITSAGWATYCSPYALDFSSAIANLDAAYMVTGGADDKLTLSPISTTIPANTGVLLKGSAGTVNIPVVASSSTDVSSNKLQGVTANTDKDANTIYVLMNDATNGIGFYKNENTFTVGANTAYLNVADLPAPSSARAFYSLGGDVTGIQELKNSRMEGSKSYYDLQGRRVANPTKGLYIVNGKKVIK